MTMTRCTDENCDRTFTTVRGMRTHARTHGDAIKGAMEALYRQRQAEPEVWVWNVSCISCRSTVESPEALERHIVHKHVVHWYRSRRGIDGATSTEAWCATVNFQEASVDGAAVTCSECREAGEDVPSSGGRFMGGRDDRVLALAQQIARPLNALARLDLVTELLEEAERLQRDLVEVAREHGSSWSAVGAALGVSRQAAQMRFAPKRPSGPEGAHPEQLTID